MSSPDNTASANYRELNAFGVLAAGVSEWVSGQEAIGQAQLVNSEALPTDTDGTDEEFIALGFAFSEPNPDDPMFRLATLPEGWRKVADEHPMWSHILDEDDRKRVSIFYKAAFYDRSASMRLNKIIEEGAPEQ